MKEKTKKQTKEKRLKQAKRKSSRIDYVYSLIFAAAKKKTFSFLFSIGEYK